MRWACISSNVKFLALGHEVGLPKQLTNGDILASVAQAEEEVFGIEYAEQMVYVVFVDRNATVPVADDQIESFAEGRIHLYGHHIEPRHHDFAHGRLTEFKDAGDHLLLVFFDHALAFANVNEEAEAVLAQEYAFGGHFVFVAAGKGSQAAQEKGERG